MKRRGRIRRTAKWAGLAACVLIAAATATSMAWRVSVLVSAIGDIAIDTGAIHILAGDQVGGAPRRISRERARGPMLWWPRAEWYTISGYTNDWYIVVPLWMPFLAFALPTACWWCDRRARPGHCACGYSLAGLSAGAPCPECGRGRA